MAHDSGWKWWLAFSFPPDFHRLHWHQLAWRTLNMLLLVLLRTTNKSLFTISFTR